MKKISITRPFFTDEELNEIAQSLSSGWVAQGPKVAEFEKKIASHEGVAECVATTSCTTALHLAMVSEGLGPGMDAIAPAFTFVATTNAIIMTGATPVLCDIKKETFNIDVDKLRSIVETKYKRMNGLLINIETGNILWGVVPVHEFGLCCDIYAIKELAKEYGLHIIEDAACALGATIGNVHQGAFGNTSCISFHPRKSITTGEGGMILTDNVVLAKKMRELRSHGSIISADARDKGNGFLLPEFSDTGFNYRMTDLQAAMGLAQIKKLDTIIDEKRRLAKLYNEIISRKLQELTIPVEPEGFFHTYQSYVCMLNLEQLKVNTIEEGSNMRNQLLLKLERSGISTRQGTHGVHLLGYYKNRFGFKPEDYLEAYACDRLSIALPLYYGLTDEEIEYVVDKMIHILEEIK